MQRALTMLGAVGLALALAGNAGAAPLAPKKPSQLVALRMSGATCDAVSPSTFKFDSRVDPADGSLSPFSIPDGQVLVITDAAFNFNNPGGDFTVSLFAVTTTAPTAVIPIASAPMKIAPANGGVTVHVGQAVLKPGLDLCANTSGGDTVSPSALNVVRGFLIKDK